MPGGFLSAGEEKTKRLVICGQACGLKPVSRFAARLMKIVDRSAATRVPDQIHF
jgi:hypothetical protein